MDEGPNILDMSSPLYILPHSTSVFTSIPLSLFLFPRLSS